MRDGPYEKCHTATSQKMVLGYVVLSIPLTFSNFLSLWCIKVAPSPSWSTFGTIVVDFRRGGWDGGHLTPTLL